MSRETKLILRSVATVMVILAMLFAFAISGVRLFGLQVYGVLTGSMEPSYPTGSLVYVKAVDPATLKVSDVITFNMGRNAVATHRIVEKVPDPDNPYSYSFRTKGDANANVDNALVLQSNIIGKVVFSLPMMGHIASYIQKPPGTYVAILISLILIAFVFITDNVNEQPSSNTRPGQRRFRSPSIWQIITTFVEKHLPLRNRRKPTKNRHLRQGYTPESRQPRQQYQHYSQPQARYPSQQPPQQYPQHQYPPQYSQPQARYPSQQPSQQYPRYQQPRQQQYQQYPQQRDQYSPQQTYQQYPQYQYPRQQEYSQQQHPQQQRASQQRPQYQYPHQQQYSQQQPSQRYPRQNPYEQLPSQQEWSQQSLPRRSRGQRNNDEDYQ